jgi:hypothetical protein
VITRLKIRPKLQPFKESNDFVFELRHGSGIGLKWQGNNHLLVIYEAGSDIHRQWDSRDGVKISYMAKTLPSNE